ncbi:MAG: ribosome-associated translation inhibitor RaiA [Flavobacteriaceae bacterium]|nr:ribosome-associated translation inhibitor RaiA [Flavobacteriaceae bacterium]
MQIVYEYVNISASDRLENYVEEKLAIISTKYPFVIRGDVFFKKENRHDNTGHLCTIRLSLKGPRIHASSEGVNFEEAIAETIRDLNDQLEKRKSKIRNY